MVFLLDTLNAVPGMRNCGIAELQLVSVAVRRIGSFLFDPLHLEFDIGAVILLGGCNVGRIRLGPASAGTAPVAGIPFGTAGVAADLQVHAAGRFSGQTRVFRIRSGIVAPEVVAAASVGRKRRPLKTQIERFAGRADVSRKNGIIRHVHSVSCFRSGCAFVSGRSVRPQRSVRRVRRRRR